MARGIDFGGVHSHRDLNLILQEIEESPANPKLNLIDIPGGDGSKDLSEQPSGRVVYGDRTITWVFGLYPGESWPAKHRQVSRALNGQRLKITQDEDPGYYYDGRVSVKTYSRDMTLRQITVEAVCSPYMLKQLETVRTESLSTTERSIILANECKPVFPQITLTAPSVIGFNGNSFSLNAGTHRLLDIELQAGVNTLTARTTSGSGTITIKYQEGAL